VEWDPQDDLMKDQGELGFCKRPSEGEIDPLSFELDRTSLTTSRLTESHEIPLQVQ